MSCTEFQAAIDDSVDDLIDARLRAELESHAAGCASCRETLAAARRLAAETARLPESVEPDRDLFPAIRSRIERKRPPRPWIAWAGAAATLLLLVTAAIVFRPGRAPESRPAHRPDTAAIPAVSGGDGPIAVADADYRRAVAELTRALEQRASSLPPETRAAVEENLAIIDEAISQVEAALRGAEADPADGRLLADLQRQKVQFLWRVSKLSS